MKKKNLKSLRLNKRNISLLDAEKVLGGLADGGANGAAQQSTLGPCYPSFDCPPPKSKRTNPCEV